MLWREGYETQVHQGVSLPPDLTGQSVAMESYDQSQFDVVVIGRDASSLVRQELWRKLIESEFGLRVRLAQVVLGIETPAHLSLMVSPERARSVYCGTGTGWPEFEDIAVLCPKGTFALVGVPTESSWDFLRERIGELLST